MSYYTNNTNASTSTSKPSLTISGLGSYVGSKTVNFTIKPRSTENLSVTFDDAVFNTANNITIQVSPQNISVKDRNLELHLSYPRISHMTSVSIGMPRITM